MVIIIENINNNQNVRDPVLVMMGFTFLSTLIIFLLINIYNIMELFFLIFYFILIFSISSYISYILLRNIPSKVSFIDEGIIFKFFLRKKKLFLLEYKFIKKVLINDKRKYIIFFTDEKIEIHTDSLTINKAVEKYCKLNNIIVLLNSEI